MGRRLPVFANAGLSFSGHSVMTQAIKLQPDDFIPTRYSLLSRLQHWDDQESWKVFFNTYWHLIYSFAIKAGLTDAEAQDVVQETVICVARNIGQFKRDRQLGTFKGWLRNITRWRIADQLRKRSEGGLRQTNLSTEIENMPNESELSGSAEAELVWEDEWRANLLAVAMENLKRKVKEEHYQIFDLHVFKQWPAEKVARTLGVSLGRVYLVKFRLGVMVKREVRWLKKSEEARVQE
jgi:RNA polymerase sigma-70 factor (ECF subfamily)